MKQSKQMEAQKDFLKAIEINKDKFSGYIGLGDCFRVKGDFANAIKNYSKVLEDDQQLMEVVGLKRVYCLIEMKELTKALHDIEKVQGVHRDTKNKREELRGAVLQRTRGSDVRREQKGRADLRGSHKPE